MNKVRTQKIVNWVLTAAIVVLAGWIVWSQLGLGAWFQRRNAIQDLLAARRVSQARQDLRDLRDRASVVAALKDALDEDAPVQGKIEVLNTLVGWRETRAARRALGSSVLSTRRAAAWVFFGDEDVRDEIRPVVVEWLEEEGAEGRQLAALVAGQLQLEECAPVLLRAVDEPPRDEQDAIFQVRALDALRSMKVEGLEDKALALAERDTLDPRVRSKAFEIVGAMKDAPTDRVQELMLGVLNDRLASNLLRHKATGVLRRAPYGNETVWTALREILLRPDDDIVIQRSCLHALGSTLPLDRLEELLLEKGVWKHRYFGVRADVATAFAAMNVRKRVVLEAMCEYMVDDDPKDILHVVRREGWFTYWALTGAVFGVEEKRLFLSPPKRTDDEKMLRRWLWSSAPTRPGITSAMVEAVAKITGDLAKMRNVRQGCQTHIGAAVERWAKQDAEKAAGKPDDEPADEPAEEPAEGPGGEEDTGG
jgi:hypothetical protein